MPIAFYSTRRVFVVDKTTGKALSFRDKKILAAFLGLSNRKYISDLFRPINGIKPTMKRYNNYEIYDPEGEYGILTRQLKARIQRKASKN